MLREQIESLISIKLKPLLDEWGVTDTKIELSPTPSPSMGDYALNTALRLAKAAKMPPIKIAERMAGLIEDECFSKIEVLNPGYVNLTLSQKAINDSLINMSKCALGLQEDSVYERVVIDYSGVNIAKQLHVGHLRSTIIGDAISRVLESQGKTVIRQNHLGDWGLPIAMVLWKAQPVLREIEQKSLNIEDELTLAELEEIYRDSAAACKDDQSNREQCQLILVALQNGDKQLLDDWHTITQVSMSEVYRLYDVLGVKLKETDERGESFYRDMLQDTIDALIQCNAVKESDGALCVFMDQFKAKDGSVLPVIVQKSDGGFNYETFDLAAIRYRINELKADRIIYVTDSRQILHFEQIFAIADLCGWSDNVKLEHVAFGSVLGEDNKPLKTRSGENIKLADLMQEAIERAYSVVNEKNQSLSEERKQEVARMVGIGAVKYADLSHERIKDYVFAWDRMLALDGNTGPYLQYAHARICSIFRKGDIDENTIDGPVILEEIIERILALKLLEFSRAVKSVEKELRPHLLCTYLYELADVFTRFYDQCPVLNSEFRDSRLFLCKMTRQVLAAGLDMLGIDALSEM